MVERLLYLQEDYSLSFQVHIISGDLTLHKRTLDPIKTLVYGLRRYDVDRCAALVTSSGLNVSKVEGFMSHKSKIYLADVHDHMDYVITSLDMFSSISENLINYTFNVGFCHLLLVYTFPNVELSDRIVSDESGYVS